MDSDTLMFENRIQEDEIKKYQTGDRDFIPDAEIERHLRELAAPDRTRVRDILAKSLAVQTLTPEETASLLKVEDPEVWEEMGRTALEVKRKVYDNRIVTFAPLYMGNRCVNNCLYCGFRRDNPMDRKVLSTEEITREVEVLAGVIGHKRLIAVYGEHPSTDVDYILKSLDTIYKVKIPKGRSTLGIRRVNVNAAPFSVDELRRIQGAGIGTYQVFQETYHHATYQKMHPGKTVKSNYAWRLYAMHRALEAGIDDVGIGALFGLYDWRFEVMGLLYHNLELEARFGIGAHTISFPRLEPALNTPFAECSPYRVSDDDLKKIIIVLRLAVPHAGLIVTAREDAQFRRQALWLGVTQTDASSRIGIGDYGRAASTQEGKKQQFYLGDTRSLEEVVRELAEMGMITSFCTAGYRCGRTGDKIMGLLRSGTEGKFCKLNAVLTFREWLDDFASPETKAVAEPLLRREIGEVRQRVPRAYDEFMKSYGRICGGERDLYF